MKPITDKMVEDMFDTTFKPLARKLDNLKKSFKSNEYYAIQTAVLTKSNIEEVKFLNLENLITLLEYYIIERDTDITKLLEIEILNAIINDSLGGEYVLEPNDRGLILHWLENEVIPEALKQIALIPSRDDRKQLSLQKDKFLELIDKSISFPLDTGKEIRFLDTGELRDILYSFIFEQNSSLKEMTQPEMITGIINESLIVDHEYKMRDEIFIGNITKWLKYHVIPYIYEHKEEYEAEDKEISLKDSSEIAEERNNGGVIEHRHESNMYWHPATRVHPRITKDKLPLAHVIGFRTKVKESKDIVEETEFKSEHPYNDKYQLIENLIIKELQKSIVSDLLRPMDLNQILYILISEKNLSLVDIIHNPGHIENIIDSSLIDPDHISESDKKEAVTWLRKTIIPKIFDEFGIKEKSPETVISEGFSGIPLKLEIITKSKISSCIFPLNLNYISKKDFEQLPKNIVDVLYTYFNDEKDLITGETIEHSDYVYNRFFYNDQENLVYTKEFKEIIFQWLNRSVIPCIIKIINEDKQKEEYIPEFKQIQLEINKDSSLYKRMDKIVRDFFDSFYLPQHHLCLYYTYYILKLKGNTDFDFEFRELENKLYKDFYNYGIFACIKELRHFLGTFHFTYKEPELETVEITDYIKHTHDKQQSITLKPGFNKLITDVSNCVGIDVKDIHKIINIDRMYEYAIVNYNNRNIDEKENKIIRDTEFLYLIEKYFGYFTRPDNILKIASKSFNITKDNKSTCKWSEQYGGEAWGSIAKTMISRSNLISKTIFVDTCWSLQHNTNLFLDKVYCYDCEGNSLSLVKRYLTEIKDGLFKNVFECAITHNNKLDRFVYKNLILENDASVPDAKYTEKHKYTEREIHRKDDRDPFALETYPHPIKEEIRKLPEKEDINIVQYDDEDKNKLYEVIDGTYGLNTAKINKLESGWNDNPNVEIIIESSPERWITDLNSIMKYINEHYPLYDNKKDQAIKNENIKEEQTLNEISIIRDIIVHNISSLRNIEFKNIILKYIVYEYLASSLQQMIYKYDYTSLQIKEHIDVLITDGFYDSNEEMSVQDSDVISALKAWIKEYLIDDLMKGTPLQSGGFDALFG